MNSQAISVARVSAFALALALASILGVVIIAALATPLGNLDLFVETPAAVGAPTYADPYRQFIEAPAAGAPSFADPHRQFVEAPAPN